MFDALVLVAMTAALIAQTYLHRKDLREARSANADELKRKDEIIASLTEQVQYNAQNMPYYPTLGPAPAPLPEVKWLSDDSGLIGFPDYDEESALDEVDRLS